MLTRFGFGKPTGLPLLGETAGLLRKPSLWSARSKPTVTIGQEISVSAVQMVQAATAIANGGVLLKPIIVKKIVSPDGKVVREYSREPLWEAVSPGVAGEMLDFMEAATSPAGHGPQGRNPRDPHLREDGNGAGGFRDRRLFRQRFHRLPAGHLPHG